MKLQRLLTSGILILTCLQIEAQTPTVVTDTRFARGATMAFGRIASEKNNGGSAIAKRGFCLSENPEPSVNDIVSTKTLSNSGTIYYFQDLKPATKYYMRAYVTNLDGVTGYGEVIKFYTIPKGQIRLEMREGGDAATYNRIKTASETAVNWWNNLTEIKDFRISVGNENVQTADCSYGGWIRVGNNQSYQRTGTLLHEMLHGVGVIPWADTEWARFNLRSGTSNASGSTTGSGLWLGDRANDVVRFLNNDNSAKLNGDYQHLWPYGINGASEDNGTDLLYIGNSLVCQALGEDGLQHTYSSFAEPYYAFNQEDTIKYYIKNESSDRGLYTSYLMPNATGQLTWVEMSEDKALQNDSVAWTITFTPNNQYYQFKNVATGQYLTYSGGTVKTATRASLTTNENFHLMKGRVDVLGTRGYWIIHPESNWTPNCMQALPGGRINVTTFDISNSAKAQRWIILTASEMSVVVNESKTDVYKSLNNAKALVAFPHTEDEAGVDNTFSTTIAELESSCASAQSFAELSAITSGIQNAVSSFLQGVTPTNKPFDITSMIVNPTIDENTDGWSTAATVNYGCGEFYEKTFDFNQTVSNLPAGTYQFMAQAFQRPGSVSTAANNTVTATIYAGTNSQNLKHIKEGGRNRTMNVGEEVVIGGKYVPGNMQAASSYFSRLYYTNTVLTTVDTNGGSLKIGIKAESMPSGYWCIFDDFHLFYYGSKSIEDVVTGISDASRLNDKGQMTNVYDLQGRRVSNPKQGLYIVNGKKLLVK